MMLNTRPTLLVFALLALGLNPNADAAVGLDRTRVIFDGGKDAIQNQQKIDAIIQKAQEQTEANRRILDDIRASQLANPQKKS